jgi:HD superfamily phosphohydrolase
MLVDNSGFSRTIRDPVHGTIHLSDEEVAVIDHKLFRRLHHIKQNGLLYHVFPSATHSRFEHSLGVLHVTNTVFYSLIRNSRVAGEKKNSAAVGLEGAKTGQAIRFDLLEKDLLVDLLRIVRLAALVHDLGHGPFSHTFDSFAPPLGHVIQAIKRENTGLNSLVDHLKEKKNDGEEGDNPTRVEHEEMSCYLFSLIWNDLLEQDTAGPAGEYLNRQEVPSLVTAIILGRPAIAKGSALQEYTSLLTDMVASAPVDADRMDYLERDSRSAGVTYGLYDRQRLMKSFLVYKGEPGEGNTESDCLRLGIKYSGLRAVENFVQARFELFVQIYYHKTNRATQLMLDRLAEIAVDRGMSVADFLNGSDLAELYIELSDERFLQILRGKDTKYAFGEGGSSDHNENDVFHDLAERIYNRELWKRIFESESEHNAAVFAILDCRERTEDAKKDSIKAKATKGLEKGAKLLKRHNNGCYATTETEAGDWLAASPMMRALAEEEEKIARIYFTGKDDHTKSSLRKEAREISQALRGADDDSN